MRRRDLLTGLLATTTSSALPTAGLSMPPINDETNALATMTPVPSASWLRAADTLISSLKTAGVWQTLDLFYCFAAPSSTACTYNWVNMTSGRLIANGNLTYSANACVASDGSTGYFSTTFNVNSSKAQDGNAEYGFFTLNECTTDNISPFQTTGGKQYMALQANSTGASIANLFAALNTSTAASFSSLWGSTVGHWVIQQNDTTAQLQAFVDGSSLGTSTQTHSADSGAVQLFRSASGSYTTRQVAFVHYGSKLTTPQQLALSKALYTFLTAMPSTGGPTGGLITNFSNAQNAIIKIGGQQYCNNTSTKPYAIAKVDDYTLRFEIRQGDMWNYDSGGVERALINGGFPPGQIADNTPMSWAYRIMVEPGGANTASWFVTSEWHNSDDELPNNWYTSPPVAIEMLGEKWSVKHMTCPAGQDCRPSSPNVKVTRAWTSSSNFVRGQWYVFEVEAKTSLTSGYLRIKCDGAQVVNYTGPLGYGCAGHFMLGLYRETNATTFAAKFKNISTSWAPNK